MFQITCNRAESVSPLYTCSVNFCRRKLSSFAGENQHGVRPQRPGAPRPLRGGERGGGGGVSVRGGALPYLTRPHLPLPVRHQAAPQQHGRPGQLPAGGPHCSPPAHQEDSAENSQHQRSNQGERSLELKPCLERAGRSVSLYNCNSLLSLNCSLAALSS